MAATTLLFADNASTVLASSISATATTCTLQSGTGALFPTPSANQAFAMSFVDAATGLVTEIVKVTGMSGDTVTSMVRGQEGTTARAWLAGDLASNFWTAGILGAGAMAQIGPMQQGTYGYAVDSGSANAVVLTLAPAITSYADGLPINFKAAATNTGASTINVNGVGAVALQGAAGALQGGELVLGKTYEANYNSTSNTFVLVGQGGGAEQVSPATASQHAVQFGQVSGVAGQVRNLAMSVATASATATLTADEIVVETALGGLRYCLASFSKTINLATAGAGGMDTGTAPTSGFVALYAIYNPTSGTAALLATNAATKQPEVYGGANMPSGYTASALVGVWPTNASKLFLANTYQSDRSISFPLVSVSSSSGIVAGSPISLASAVPLNAKTCGGIISITLSATGAGAFYMYSNSGLSGTTALAASSNNAGTGGVSNGFNGLAITTAQQAYIVVSGTASVSNFNSAISTYTF
jgi:hypothetical protein